MPAQKHINSVLLQEDSVIQFFAEVCGAMGMSLPQSIILPQGEKEELGLEEVGGEEGGVLHVRSHINSWCVEKVRVEVSPIRARAKDI